MFDYGLDFRQTDFREHPELYRIGKGEQGVLLVEPYKGEILPHWRFRTPEVARQSADTILALFRRYRDAGDFVGMDMARKFLQMGYTRSRRYANHRSGRKWSADHREVLPRAEDPAKAECAALFRTRLEEAKADAEYQRLKTLHQQRYERSGNARAGLR